MRFILGARAFVRRRRTQCLLQKPSVRRGGRLRTDRSSKTSSFFLLLVVQRLRLRFQYGGNFNSSGFNNQGTNGNYWSATQNNASNGRNLNFNSSALNTNNNNKNNGFSVRCVAQ